MTQSFDTAMNHTEWNNLSREMACHQYAMDGAEIMREYASSMNYAAESLRLSDENKNDALELNRVRDIRNRVYTMGQALIALEKMGYAIVRK